jgi:flagellar FliL protein
MSAAAAQPVEDGQAPPKGRKKLIVLVAAVLLVGAAGTGTAVFISKKRAAAAEAAEAPDDEGGAVAQPSHRDAHKGPPAFLPLDPFIVNLADHDAERFAQIGVTLELDDPKSAEELRAYMPAIRNGILMVIAHKSSQELLTRAGKEKLASEIMREAVRPLGIELEDDDAQSKAKVEHSSPRTAVDESPVRHVHFSSFIIQ